MAQEQAAGSSFRLLPGKTYPDYLKRAHNFTLRDVPTINVDENPLDQDWTKGAWDLPPYKSPAFLRGLAASGENLEDFRKLPVYQLAVQRGLIVDDEWAGGPHDKTDFFHDGGSKEQEVSNATGRRSHEGCPR
jgi:hypothetical protein